MVFVRKPGGRGVLRPQIPTLTPREGVGGLRDFEGNVLTDFEGNPLTGVN